MTMPLTSEDVDRKIADALADYDAQRRKGQRIIEVDPAEWEAQRANKWQAEPQVPASGWRGIGRRLGDRAGETALWGAGTLFAIGLVGSNISTIVLLSRHH